MRPSNTQSARLSSLTPSPSSIPASESSDLHGSLSTNVNLGAVENSSMRQIPIVNSQIEPSLSFHSVIEHAQYLASEEASSAMSHSLSLPEVIDPFSNAVELEEDDNEANDHIDSLMAEGIGEEDMGGLEEDNPEEYDEEDKVTEIYQSVEATTGDSSSSKSKSKRVPYPSWFQKYLDEIHAQLRNDRASASGQSRLYKSGTFWFPIKSSWAALKNTQVCPSDLFTPRFFLWDPADLHRVGVGCPNCKQRLERNGILRRPRRVVDIDDCFWIIGYSYRCVSCKKRFSSWDDRILKMLPRPLAAQFPAHLTWRSGLSLRALGVLRSCIQNGMGAHQVSAMFRVQHLLRYDELRYQYLDTMVSCLNSPGQRYEAFLPFDNNSNKGFHGFVPSGQWFRDVYDNFIESHINSFNQHTAMLTGRICAIDHSHKVFFCILVCELV